MHREHQKETAIIQQMKMTRKTMPNTIRRQRTITMIPMNRLGADHSEETASVRAQGCCEQPGLKRDVQDTEQKGSMRGLNSFNMNSIAITAKTTFIVDYENSTKSCDM